MSEGLLIFGFKNTSLMTESHIFERKKTLKIKVAIFPKVVALHLDI